ncbi:alpha-L-fucosidase [Polaribacter vadi]|uniref:alpha-L-fucosidase n=1 Tax=Polaribacter TaxID=52959 RepID=UPI001C081B71|nr:MULTISPECIES: alpha-L-fucosidase [Polaribacter]MBU3012077.1 alpha-L-fucosidase [Polaribacter vadi]MDO6741892.1 alpha-L-fucosidase [Polaribacter sp. 1_MG-2023]
MKRKKHITIICLMMLTVVSFLSCQDKKETVVKESKSENMDEMWGAKDVSLQELKEGKAKLFDEGNFGMFIHWGLYSKLAGVWNKKTYYGIGEWIMHPRVADIPPKEYMKIADDYNPINFDAKKIAQLAKDAGMKYIIITSKHHEGFAMFDSKVSDFNIVNTPFGRDPMKELSAACKELGLGFGFYYSHNQDWTSPGATGGPKKDANGQEASFKDYFYNKCKPQVKEICTNYGDLDFVWFDTPGNMKKEYVVELATMVRELQPNAMMSSRVGHGMGDYSSNGDMEVPNKNIKGLWETCDTNNDSWSYAWYDNNFKSPKEILNRLISTVARGGTYLFNVGPNQDGEIPEIGVKFLKEAGDWIKKYPQVVYNAGASPWQHALPWGDVTTKENSLFLSVLDWPEDGKLYLPGLTAKIISASLLKGNKTQNLTFTKKKDWTLIELPFQPSDSPVSVIEVKLDTATKNIKVDTTLGVYPNYDALLRAEFAEVDNAEEKEIKWMEKFGEWKHVNQVSNWNDKSKVTWTVNVQEAGYYYLELNYKGEKRLVWKTETDEGIMIQNQQAATEKYNFYNMGIIEFKTSGKHTVTVSLVEGNPKTSSLKAVLIKPIK